MIVPTDGGLEIRDAGTINGTFVNGVRIEAAPLREGDVVTIGNLDLVFSGGTLIGRSETAAVARTGGLEVRGASLTIEQGRTLLDNIAFFGPTRDADRGDRSVRCGQIDTGEAHCRSDLSDPGPSVLRRPRHSRRVRLAAQSDRAGAAGRCGAQPAHRGPGAELRRRVAVAAGHHQRRPAPGRCTGARGAGIDPAREHARRQAVGRSAQACVGGDGTPDGTVAADPGRADVGSGPRAGPTGDDDAAQARRRGPRRHRRHPLPELSERVRPGRAAGSGRQDGFQRFTRRSRARDGHDGLGRHLQRGRYPSRCGQPTLSCAGQADRRRRRRPKSRPIWASRLRPACGDSSRQSHAGKCG